MKIAKIEAIILRAPYGDLDAYWATGFWGTRAQGKSKKPVISAQQVEDRTLWRLRAAYPPAIETTVVKITSDDGCVGWGECHAPIAPEVTASIIDHLLAPQLIGEDPMLVDRLWEKMYGSMRIRGHNTGFMMEAIAGIDIALWDLFGRAVGLPVHKLMGGGYRAKVRTYQSHLPVMAPDDMAELALDAVKAGFTAIKVTGGAGVATDILNMHTIRRAVGPDVDLMLDAGGVYDLSSAVRVGRGLEAIDALFFEDPLPPEDLPGYVDLCAALDIAVAMGETEGNRYQFRERLARKAVDVVLPDISRAGGLSEARKIAILADVFNVLFCPHVSVGSAIYSAASLHIAAAIPNLLMYEFWNAGNPLGDGLCTERFQYTDGYLTVPQGPGLGIQMDEEKLAKYVVRQEH